MDTTVVLGVVVAVLVLAGVAGSIVMRWRRRPARPAFSPRSEDRTVVGFEVGPARSDATVVDVRVNSTPAELRSDATMVGAPPARPEPAMTPAPAEAPTVVVSGARQDVTAPTIRIERTSGRVTITKGGSGSFPIEARDYVIGRSNRSDIVVEDPSVSGQHARLSVATGGSASVTDLGSSNGTTVNGQKVQGSQAVRSGDTIGVGEALLRLELS